MVSLHGFRECPARGMHWGPLGAAGVLPWAAWSEPGVVLLGKRGPDVQDPGVWSCFGGAIDEGEDAALAAWRELREEAGGIRGARLAERPAHVMTCEACGWQYTTYLARVQLDSEGRLPVAWPRVRWETSDVQWVRADKVTDLPLLGAFTASWPAVRAEVEAARKEAVQ